MVKPDSSELPALGERVELTWGLGSVSGRVRETYRGVRPRVVVEIDPGQVGDEAETVTVPVGAVKPLTESPWASEYRYERDVAAAIEGMLDDYLAAIVLDAEIEKGEIDILAHLTDGRILAVEVKGSQSLRLREFSQALRKLRSDAISVGGQGLLVTRSRDGGSVGEILSEGLAVVFWRSPTDNRQLATALNHLLQLDLPEG